MRVLRLRAVGVRVLALLLARRRGHLARGLPRRVAEAEAEDRAQQSVGVARVRLDLRVAAAALARLDREAPALAEVEVALRELVRVGPVGPDAVRILGEVLRVERVERAQVVHRA